MKSTIKKGQKVTCPYIDGSGVATVKHVWPDGTADIKYPGHWYVVSVPSEYLKPANSYKQSF
jgi:predicted DNA-binding transcriptional regulator YafY